jgi:hypothetical protein
MSTAPATPMFKSAAHRRAVMQGLAASIVPTAVGFALLGPFTGLLLIWGSVFVAMLCETFTGSGLGIALVLNIFWQATVSAYVSVAIPAAIAGVWVAVFSPFVPEHQRFYAGAALLGAVTTFLFMSITPPAPGVLGGPLFLAIVGAVASFICAWAMRDYPLRRNEAHRDKLARERAERLARERAAASPAA